jgi:3-isopropylmalate/(R)-2-methylmalate dehydratase small subunit
MMPVLAGRAAFVFDEANFDVDRILGFDAMRAHDAEAMRASAMRAFDPDFLSVVQAGDLLVGGANFGYGHPHGPPMDTMRRLGVAGVIAESFAPLYVMGELAAGFPQITCPGILSTTERWDRLSVDWETGTMTNGRSGQVLKIAPPTDHERQLLEAGGLFPLLRQGMI